MRRAGQRGSLGDVRVSMIHGSSICTGAWRMAWRTRVRWMRRKTFSRNGRESESDSAGPLATVTEVRNMVVLESKSERSRRLPSQRIGGARHDAHAYS